MRQDVPLLCVSQADVGRAMIAILETESVAPAVVVGRAEGNWAARVLANDRPDLDAFAFWGWPIDCLSQHR